MASVYVGGSVDSLAAASWRVTIRTLSAKSEHYDKLRYLSE